MTNMELLNFRFVDREREREITNDFLRNKNNVKTIIVRGKKHAGKNFFIDEIIKENQSLSFIVFDFNQLNNKCAYKLIIDELEKYSNGEFFHFVKHNYTDILQITTNGVRNISKITGNSNVSDILGYMLDSSMFFLNSHKQQESSIKLLNKYIKQIDQNENLVIIIKESAPEAEGRKPACGCIQTDLWLHAAGAGQTDIEYGTCKNVQAGKRQSFL